MSNSLIIIQFAARSVLQGVWKPFYSPFYSIPAPLHISLSVILSVSLACLPRSSTWVIPPSHISRCWFWGSGEASTRPTNQPARSSPGRHLIPSRVCSSSPSLPPRFLTRRVSISSPPVRRLSRRWPLASRTPNPRYASPVAASGVQVTEPCSATIAVIPSQCFGVSVHAP